MQPHKLHKQVLKRQNKTQVVQVAVVVEDIILVPLQAAAVAVVPLLVPLLLVPLPLVQVLVAAVHLDHQVPLVHQVHQVRLDHQVDMVAVTVEDMVLEVPLVLDEVKHSGSLSLQTL